VRHSLFASDLKFVGLHWLLAAPAGLHATSVEPGIRRQTWNFFGSFIDLCADLKSSDDDSAVLVFGSPKQRTATNGISPPEAVQILVEELARIASRAASRNITILIEPLSSDQTNVVNTLEEAVRIVQEIGSPAIQTMFDVHNAADETRPHPELIRQYFEYIKHVHVNEMDGREPGTGDYDFGALLSTLATLNYRGWVSLEVFDFSRDYRDVASRALQHLEQPLGVPHRSKNI
jgi:D-psicose/D-tagatose/L-ribulose 3-epimerase